MPGPSGPLRIGEFARRVGVSAELLRAWERRYDLLQPVRSPGGFRLYTEEDAARVARMRQALDDGLSAAEAARVAIGEARAPGRPLDDARTRLLAAARAYDEAGVQSVFDETLAAFRVETVVRELVLPALVDVGEDWRRGELEIAQEHFASNLIRGRLLALARSWGRGGGPLAVLACVPGEQHDISLLAFGLVLRAYGWRILFLGADTPVVTLAHAAAETAPALVVATCFDSGLIEAHAAQLRKLAKTVPLAISGPGTSDALAKRLGARRLDGDVVAAAGEIAGAA